LFKETLENPASLREMGARIAVQDWVKGCKQLGFTDYELTTA